MAKRGKVLRDPHFGPGLLMVEGKQYPFLMEGLWRSEVPAKPGLAVNVDFDTSGKLNGITAVPQSELDQERAALAQAGGRSRVFDRKAGVGSVARVVATGAIVACWFFLTAVSIHPPFFGNLDLSFWQVLGYLNTGSSLQLLELPGNPDSGVFGFLAILVLTGPFLHYLWKDQRALLGGILPLSFMTLVAYRVGAVIHAVSAQLPALYPGPEADLRYGVFNALSVGLGTYVSASLAIYLAVVSTKQFLGSSRLRERPVCSSQKVAA